MMDMEYAGKIKESIGDGVSKLHARRVEGGLKLVRGLFLMGFNPSEVGNHCDHCDEVQNEKTPSVPKIYNPGTHHVIPIQRNPDA